MLALFVRMLEFLARLSKLHDLCRQLCITSVMLTWCISVCRLYCTLFPEKVFFGLPSFPYLLQSPVLWVFCAPPCFLHRAQCFASLRDFFRIRSLKETICFLEDPPPVALALGPLCFSWLGGPFRCAQVLLVACKRSGVQYRP